jgi:hypothetical protein
MAERSHALLDAVAEAKRIDADRQTQLILLRDHLTQKTHTALFVIACFTAKCAPLFESVWGSAAEVDQATLVDTIIQECASDDRLLWTMLDLDPNYDGVCVGHFADKKNHICLPLNVDAVARFSGVWGVVTFGASHPDWPATLVRVRSQLERAGLLSSKPIHSTFCADVPIVGACVRSQAAFEIFEADAVRNLGYQGPTPERAAQDERIRSRRRGRCVCCMKEVAAAAQPQQKA